MTDDDNPAMLDDLIYQKFQRAAKSKNYERMLDVLTEAAASLSARPYTGEMSKIDVGTVLIIMVDSVKVLTGEEGNIARDLPYFNPYRDGGLGEAVKWQKWLHSLEVLALATGEDLGELPHVMREEYLGIEGFVRSDPTARLIRLWRASRPFVFRWQRLSRLSRDTNDPNDLDSYDQHAAALLGIMEYLFGRSGNWPPAARDLHAEQMQLLKDNLRLSPTALLDEWQEQMDKWREEDDAEEDGAEEDYGDDDGPIGQRAEPLLNGLRRYFPDVDSRANAPTFFLLRCLVVRSGGLSNGFAAIYDDRLLTFTDEDCLVADIRQGHPRVGLLKDLSECSVQHPPGFQIPSTRYVSIDPSPASRHDAVSIILTFGEGDQAGNEAVLASTGIGYGQDQQQIAKDTVGKFLSHLDGVMSSNKGATGSGQPSPR